MKSSAETSVLSRAAVPLLPVVLVSLMTVVFASAKSYPQQSETSSPGALQAGKRIWTTSCASCHGLDGRGGEHAPNIATKPETVHLSNAEIFRIVRNGSPSMAMPSFGSSLDESKINAVVGYVRRLQGGQRYESLPGDAQAGESLFHGKAGCDACHLAGAAGGFMGSDLTEYARAHAIREIRDAIVNPNKDLDPHNKGAVVITRDGQEFMGIARNEDNFSLQLQTSDGTFHLFLKSDLQKFEYQAQSLMPSDYGSRLSSAELNDVISFLMRTARDTSSKAASAAR